MSPSSLRQAIENAFPVLRSESPLVRLPDERPCVFVGDTHGQRDTTETVLQRFSPERYTLVFLGDYVDRGPDSAGNLQLLLESKRAHPDTVHLLQGNHEGYAIFPFEPCDFWKGLPDEDRLFVADALTELPFAAVTADASVLALHGVPPDVDTLDTFESIEPGDAHWRRITWGDVGEGGGFSPSSDVRPRFSCDDICRVLDALGCETLIRAHQPDAPLWQCDDRCLTILTAETRQVAVTERGEVRVEEIERMDNERG